MPPATQEIGGTGGGVIRLTQLFREKKPGAGGTAGQCGRDQGRNRSDRQSIPPNGSGGFRRFASGHLVLSEIDPEDFRTAATLPDTTGTLLSGDALHLAAVRRMRARSPAPTFPTEPLWQSNRGLQLLEQGRGDQAEITDGGLQVDPGFPDTDDSLKKGSIPRPVELFEQRQLLITHAKLLAQLHAARATNVFERKLQQLARIDVLAIDDFGLRPMRSPQDEDFHDLVDARYERKTTLLTSNLDFDEWGAAFPNKLMGAATLDRLRDGAYRIVLDGETRRKPRPLPDSPALPAASAAPRSKRPPAS